MSNSQASPNSASPDQLLTSNQSFFNDKHAAKQRDFGENEQRKMRYIIETSGENCEKDSRWSEIMSSMQKQQIKFSNNPLTLKDRIVKEV